MIALLKSKTNNIKTALAEHEALDVSKKMFIIFASIVCIITSLVIVVIRIDYPNNVITEENSVTKQTEQYVSPIKAKMEHVETDLEKLGLDKKMYPSPKGFTVCANCNLDLPIEVKQFTLVIAQDDSFVRMHLCANCFQAISELLSSVGQQ